MSGIRWVRWTKWTRDGLAGVGQMPHNTVDAKLHEFGVEARKLLEETGADHVLYGVKQYDDGGALEEVRFYLEPMTDEEFDARVASVPGVLVYALHKMPHKGK